MPLADIFKHAAGASRRVATRYLVFALLYMLYTLLVPLIQNPSTPAAAYMGLGACYGISSSSSSPHSGVSSIAAKHYTSTGKQGFALSSAVAGLVRRVVQVLQAEVCWQLEGLCSSRLWPAKDCDVLFLHNASNSFVTTVM